MISFHRCLAILAGLMTACTAPAAGAELDPAEWMYFSMYPGDTAHSVHLSALRVRADGLLESASRYPLHSEDAWTPEEFALAWYEYAPRLIDCETGYSIMTHQQLLDEQGKPVAQHDDAAQSLARWKDGLRAELRNHKWPDDSEFFLACASAADNRLLAARRGLAKKPLPRLAYKPLIATLRPDTTAMWKRRLWQYEVDASKKKAPATPTELFDQAVRHYRAWLATFMPGGTAMAEPAATAPHAGLSTEIRRWLADHGADVEALSSRGDGTVIYVDREPSTFDVPYELLQQRPDNAAEATRADLQIHLDCASGVRVPTRLDWLDGKRNLMATQPMPTALLATHLMRQLAGAQQEERNILSMPALTDVGRLVCLAAAAQCTGTTPKEVPAFELSVDAAEAIKQATAPEAALLALRAAYRSYRQRFVPACSIGANN